MKYFLYCRKSTDEEGKQVLSLESQDIEMIRRAKDWRDVDIVEKLVESMSAKAPGRPVFDDMVRRIAKGEAEGIVAWDPDRLARNSIDGGKIVHMIDTGKLKDLKFATYTFENTAQGKFMLSIMFGHSKYYVDALSVGVKRGMRTKAEKGWLPNLAPIGYTNDAVTNVIVRDPERFDLIRRMWQLMLTGGYSIRQIRKVVTEEWGLRTVKRKKNGGGSMTLSGFYRVFANPFYAGVFVWNGKTWPGKHEAMITLAEFERVQILLGRPSAARPKHREFAFTGLIRCGECGFAITAEAQTNRFGSRYTYYHCTKKKPGYCCSQKYVSGTSLEAQIASFLTTLRLPSSTTQWAAARMQGEESARGTNVEAAKLSLDRAMATNARERANLTTLRLRDQLEDADFDHRREVLDRDRLRLTEERAALDEQRSWIEPYEKLVLFSNRAAEWFRVGDARTKRLILQVVGSNPTIKDKKLLVEAKQPFREWSWPARVSEWCSTLNDVRTLTATNNAEFRQTIASIDEIITRMAILDERTKAA